MPEILPRTQDDSDDLVRLYISDIRRFALLSKDGEVRLGQQIEQGIAAREQLKDATLRGPAQERELRSVARRGEAARELLVQSNLRLVIHVARKYRRSGLPLVDLIQEGNIGLMRAVEKYDWRLGFRFSTYAMWWIRQAITRGIANTGRTIRIPTHTGVVLAVLRAARARVEVDLGRAPTVSELAAELELPEDRVVELLQYEIVPVSLDEPAAVDSATELGDLVPDRTAVAPLDAAVYTALRDDVAALLDSLNERERGVIALRFGLDRGEPRTLEEVGNYFDVSRERIRQIERRAMTKLREPENAATVRTLLEA